MPKYRCEVRESRSWVYEIDAESGPAAMGEAERRAKVSDPTDNEPLQAVSVNILNATSEEEAELLIKELAVLQEEAKNLRLLRESGSMDRIKLARWSSLFDQIRDADNRLRQLRPWWRS